MCQHIRIMLILDSAITIRGAAAIPWVYQYQDSALSPVGKGD